jgi:hypothetical protein
MKIILTSKPNFEDCSIEAGLDDGKRHFDHHGKYSDLLAPCNRSFQSQDCEVIEVTHMDPDCFIGVLKLAGQFNPADLLSNGVDFNTMEQIDLNGSSVVDKFDTTLLYMVGVGQWLRANKMPRVSEERQDITHLVQGLCLVPASKLIDMGRLAQEKAWTDYIACKKAFDRVSGVVFISCDASHAIDPSLPYGDKFEGFDGYSRVVVYRAHYKSVSIYCSPSSSFGYAGQTIAGIAFAGHPKACGSPRGVEITEEQAQAVWSELIK